MVLLLSFYTRRSYALAGLNQRVQVSTMHVNGSNCFDPLAIVRLAGTLTVNKISLTSTSVSGQVINFAGNITDTAFTGTFTINGGCADGALVLSVFEYP
jgi:hypothetical protein